MADRCRRRLPAATERFSSRRASPAEATLVAGASVAAAAAQRRRRRPEGWRCAAAPRRALGVGADDAGGSTRWSASLTSTSSVSVTTWAAVTRWPAVDHEACADAGMGQHALAALGSACAPPSAAGSGARHAVDADGEGQRIAHSARPRTFAWRAGLGHLAQPAASAKRQGGEDGGGADHRQG